MYIYIYIYRVFATGGNGRKVPPHHHPKICSFPPHLEKLLPSRLLPPPPNFYPLHHYATIFKL